MKSCQNGDPVCTLSPKSDRKSSRRPSIDNIELAYIDKVTATSEGEFHWLFACTTIFYRLNLIESILNQIIPKTASRMSIICRINRDSN